MIFRLEMQIMKNSEVCVRFNDGQWADRNCKSEFRFICEGSIEAPGKLVGTIQNL